MTTGGILQDACKTDFRPFQRSMKKIAAIILENNNGELLFYLRDDKEGLPFPGHWDLFGGHIEEGETPDQALVREVREELDWDLKEYSFFKKYECLEGDAWPNIKYIFTGKIDKPVHELNLKEGTRLKLFSRDEIPDIKFANILKSIVMDYLDHSK
jgi:8-oxo-dGTP diphosphatase